MSLPLRISVPRKSLDTEKTQIRIIVKAKSDDKITSVEETNFMGPEPRK